MNTNEIAFIIYKNKLLWYEECIRYIQDLQIPENYCIDIISIEDAESMAAAYNVAMRSSNAKYKIYLHQDVFILNRRFLFEILDIFNGDSSIGMIGMVGGRKLPADANCHRKWDIGRVLVYNGMNVLDLDFRTLIEEEKKYHMAETIDGFIMVTQYDYEWQEDFLDGWHFYDISQVLEMRKHGKKTIVPWQATAWCYHDCGLNNWDYYEEYRKKMLEHYPEFFDQKKASVGEPTDEQIDKEMLVELRRHLVKVMESGAYDEVWKIANQIRELKDREIREIANLSAIYALEKASVCTVLSEWWRLHDWQQLYEYYNRVRFMLIRMEYQGKEKDEEELIKSVAEGRIHKDAVMSIAHTTLSDTSNVYRILLKKEYEKPLVSVIMPVYNGADFVGKTIENVLEQTYRNFEFIIVDDASTDHSREVIQLYKDSRIRTIFLEKNQNVVNSENIGFKNAKGKYIATIGHDDLWKEDKLEKQIAFLEDHPSYCLSFTWVDIIDENFRIVNQRERYLYDRFHAANETADAWSRDLFINGNFFCAPSVCIRREALEKVGYYRYALLQLQDLDLWMRLLLEGEVYVYPEKLTYYRRFSDGRNLSVMNEETQIRTRYEFRYIASTYLQKLPKDRFVRIFGNDMRRANAAGEKEILIEKAFFLWNQRIDLARYWFAEILEDEECRRILEEKYYFDLNDFYKINAKIIH